MLENVIGKALEHTTLGRRDAGRAIERALPVSTVKQAARVMPAASRDAVAETARVGAAELPTRAEAAVMTAATTRNKITFHVAPEASQAALIDSIKTARDSFYIETFIWHNDAAGNEVIQALADRVAAAKAAGKPFDAKVLIDWFGLHQGTGGTGDPQIVEKLRAAGVQVIEFAPGYVSDGHLIPLTHRKLYIKDGTSFMSGGRNIGDEYLHPTFVDPIGKPETSWHDLLYTVEGDETGRVLDQFFKNWEHAGGALPEVRPTVVPSATGHARVQSFVTNPLEHNFALQKAQLGLIANATKEIVVMYPYLSDNALIDALKAAKQKNPALSIKVILPANKEVTREGGIYTMLNRDSARRLMADGIEVRMFSGGVVDGRAVDRFSHFKGMVIDGKVLSIGSANGDARTFKDNHELINVIADAGAARDFIKQVISPDWAAAKPLTWADLATDSWWVKVKTRVLATLDFLL